MHTAHSTVAPWGPCGDHTPHILLVTALTAHCTHITQYCTAQGINCISQLCISIRPAAAAVVDAGQTMVLLVLLEIMSHYKMTPAAFAPFNS